MVDTKKLTMPFPKEAIRWRWADKKQTRKLDYVEGHTIIHRLNDATENVWNFTVDKVERFQLDAENTMVTAYVTLELPGLGKRSHIGVQAVNARGGEDLVKGAITDGLKKAATLFGVGLELYGPDYEAGEISDAPHAELPARTRTDGQNTMPTARAGVPPTEPQFRKIGALARSLGMSDDDLHEIAGVRTLHDLDRAQMSALIEKLTALEADGDDDGPEEDTGIVGWTQFWNYARSIGLHDKNVVEPKIGALGQDPNNAYLRLQAWAKDNARQLAVVS